MDLAFGRNSAVSAASLVTEMLVKSRGPVLGISVHRDGRIRKMKVSECYIARVMLCHEVSL